MAEARQESFFPATGLSVLVLAAGALARTLLGGEIGAALEFELCGDGLFATILSGPDRFTIAWTVEICTGFPAPRQYEPMPKMPIIAKSPPARIGKILVGTKSCLQTSQNILLSVKDGFGRSIFSPQ
jgi:hypothetical protein